MSSDQTLRSACSEMSAYIAILLTHTSFDPKKVAQTGEELRGWAISVSEEGEYLLKHKLNLARPVHENIYALVKPTSAYNEHFASGQYDDCFDDILKSYLGFVEWKGDVSTTRAWFTPPPNHNHILKLLVEMDYLVASNGEMKWADLAGHAMLCAGAWTPELQSHREVEEWQREKDARRIAKNLPSDLIFLAINNPSAAFWPIHNMLSGEMWTQMPSKLLVERVIDIIHSKNSRQASDGS